jgi:AraC-like DNA-binding protein
MKRVRRMIFQLASDFNTRGALFSDLAAAEMSRIAIMKFLMYTRHNYTHFLFRKPPASNSSAVKIVEEFIEANWHKPIDIEAMSAVARTSARSLYRQFKKDRGYSPADFRQAHQARPRAGNAGASRGKRVGDPDRAEMRFPEPRPFRS